MTTPNKYWFHADQRLGAKLDRQSIPAAWRDDVPTKPEPYIAAPELARAVNLAIHLGRPLLLEGEAGCGKTRLARAVAYELGLPFYAWYVTSSSRAREGLYSYDALLRLHDVQLRKESELSAAPLPRDPGNPKCYRDWQALGKAFDVARQGERAVVLIDEIDKADADFPNDLLTVLDDDYKFTVPETGEEIRARREDGTQVKPIIIITSNREKGDLPEPFLRRCLYFYVEFPDESALRRIVAEHAGDPKKAKNDLVKAAVSRFTKERQTKLWRKPGTSEFLDWLKALETFGQNELAQPYSANQLRDATALPFPETLFKVRDDWRSHADNTK